MTRPRNAFSTPKGDRLFAAVFTVGQLRAMYEENGGYLTARRKAYLRRFIPPYSNGTGTSREFVIMLPKTWAVENLPDEILADWRPLFSRMTRAWIAANAPWLGDEAHALSPTAIDNELAPELDDADAPDSMDEPDE